MNVFRFSSAVAHGRPVARRKFSSGILIVCSLFSPILPLLLSPAETVADIPDNGVFNACVNLSSGNVFLIDTSKGET